VGLETHEDDVVGARGAQAMAEPSAPSKENAVFTSGAVSPRSFSSWEAWRRSPFGILFGDDEGTPSRRAPPRRDLDVGIISSRRSASIALKSRSCTSTTTSTSPWRPPRSCIVAQHSATHALSRPRYWSASATCMAGARRLRRGPRSCARHAATSADRAPTVRAAAWPREQSLGVRRHRQRRRSGVARARS